eukprot:4836584-Prymnesium_polylepis.1
MELSDGCASPCCTAAAEWPLCDGMVGGGRACCLGTTGAAIAGVAAGAANCGGNVAGCAGVATPEADGGVGNSGCTVAMVATVAAGGSAGRMSCATTGGAPASSHGSEGSTVALYAARLGAMGWPYVSVCSARTSSW